MKNKSVYLASSYDNKTFVQVLADALQVWGFNIVGDWFNTPGVECVKKRAELDYSAIDLADAVLAIYPYGYGTSSEMGYALGAGKQVVYLSAFGLDDAPLPAGHKRTQVATNVAEAVKLLSY